MTESWSKPLRTVFFYSGIAVLLIFFLGPPLWLVSTSIKLPKDAFALPPKLIFTPTLENYQALLGNDQFLRALFNSIVIAGTSTVISVGMAALAAYALVFFGLPRKKGIITFFLSLRVAPAIIFALPVFYLTVNIGIRDSHLIMITVYTVMNLPIAILLLLTFFEDVPGEIREAALIDGCSEWLCFRKVMAPLVSGGLTATMILVLLFSWNEFLLALVLTGQNTQTLPVAITNFLTFQGTDWGAMSAAGTIIMTPMLILGIAVQRYLVRGMTLGGIK
ncbi:carbohydrate ABC transporter permease [Notoacmeibacter ruber]|uniref:Carbohydrate ABC transporter permease n=1 Tax=Notoacmeibacter ruber TaxID=2670375 RepID=A0A3L7J3Y1_9HYPH|nr:carbohydrate ABC transporter permease [Notoacmeibacter ruber]RLQ85293.1 carbohydrate ABC transporter permease [Notoacmeibacter ruber]